MRQVVLDTETTGLDHQHGHRIIEIGCVEIQNRRLSDKKFHCYLNPQREVDEAAFEVHGLSDEFLAGQALFAQVAEEFLDFVSGAELVIHNAPFDVGFLNSELSQLRPRQAKLESRCSIVDSLALAKKKHPGQRNNLDALCKRYGVDNTQRQLHGALLDAEILADVYLLMTSGQSSLLLREEEEGEAQRQADTVKLVDPNRPPLLIIQASAAELADHQARLDAIAETTGNKCLWQQLEQS